jgi:ABC-type spermidine/putrescine transport system permease subunit II
MVKTTDGVRTTITEDKLIVEIPTQLLENSVEMGVTTNCYAKVLDTSQMIEFYARSFDISTADSTFGIFIDSLVIEALNQGESWLELDED